MSLTFGLSIMGFSEELPNLVGGNGKGDPGCHLQSINPYDLSILHTHTHIKILAKNIFHTIKMRKAGVLQIPEKASSHSIMTSVFFSL